jgi:DNA-binding NarL/FixJ family response regulator
MPIPIVIMDMPRMLREIIRNLVAGQPDMQIVREVHERASLAATVDKTGATLIIVGQHNPADLGVCRDLLSERSRLKVLAVAGDALESSLYELSLQIRALGEISPEGLLAIIRSTSRGSSGGRSANS